MNLIYKVTERGTLQQMETNGSDSLFAVGDLFIWATNRAVAEEIAKDHLTPTQ